MKKFFLISLVLSGLLFSQRPTLSTGATFVKRIAFTLDSTETKVVYCSYLSAQDDYYLSMGSTSIDTVALDSSLFYDKYSSGNVHLNFVIDTLTAEESDSLGIAMCPYNYSKGKGAWHVSTNDTTFLIADTKGVSMSNVYSTDDWDYLNWTSGCAYDIPLGGETWGGSGLAFLFKQLASNVANASTRIYLEIYLTIGD